MARLLRISVVTSLFGALALVGCNNGGDTTHDSGVGTDSGPRDSGPGTDSGPRDLGGTDLGGALDLGGTGMCPAGACNIGTGGGCGAGMACQFLLTSADASVPSPVCQAAGTAASGAHCTMPTDCAEGLTCDTGTMTCRHYCCNVGATGECPTGQICNISITSGSPPTPTGVGLCSNADDACDVIAQTGCTPASYGCYPGMGGTTQCATPGTISDTTTACMFLNDCAPGRACIGMAGGTVSHCATVCNTTATDGGPGSCPSGMTCGVVTGFPTNLGVCG